MFKVKHHVLILSVVEMKPFIWDLLCASSAY